MNNELKCTLIRTAQAMGQYKTTNVDANKAAAAFRLVAVGSKNTIVWQDGRTEIVSDSKLAKLQAANAWTTDF